MRARYFYGYNIVAACFAIQGICLGVMFAYGVFFKEFQVEFGWSRATISGTSSLSFLVMGVVGILAGRLNDRIGPKILIVAAGISYGLGFFFISRLQAPWQLYLLYGVLVGAALSTHEVITLSTVTRWFMRRRGLMSGVVKVGTGFGQLLLPLIATALITAYGWRNACVIIGTVVLVTLIAAAQALRRDPQEMGLLPDGVSNESWSAGNGSEERGVPLMTAVRMNQFWIICVAESVILFCLMTVIVHIVPHATDLGLPPVTATAVLSTIGGVSMIGRIVMGAMIDMIGGKRSLLICLSALICGLISLQMAAEAWMLFLFATIYGFAHGGLFTIMSPTVAELFGTGSHGVIFGIVMFSGAMGGAVGPMLAGRAFDVSGSYQLVFLVLTGLAVLGFVLITLLRSPRVADTGR